MKLLKNQEGLSVVELVIALAISLLVVAAAGFILLTQSGVIRLTKSVSTEQQRLNTAFNTVRYSLRMAGFDYGQNYYIQTGSVPPVQIVQAVYPTNPYEVLVSYSSVVNGASPCILTPTGAVAGEFNLGQYCNVNNFYVGQILNITNPVPLPNQPLPTLPITLCVTAIPAGNKIQTNPPGAAAGPGVCPANPVPPKNIGGGSVSSINQILFYWGNQSYGTQNSGFNPPFNVPGNLYECMVNPVVISPTAPTCAANTTITLSDYINAFVVTPSNQLNQYKQPYLYNLSITGESNVALSDSPAYSVHVPYNANANGANAKGNAGQIVGNNILKTLNSSVFLRNVFYGS
ncbi:MAG: hypothetical protein M1478_02105 [Deltaproteobacteria bacterium]|nr:hypothetical protein [Deltaproteobacteria bacterium]MCL5879608.1 hypothetical protein [Deltaproteobacteria bacterium]